MPGEDDSRDADDFGFDLETRFFFVHQFGVQVADMIAGWATFAASGLVQALRAEEAGSVGWFEQGADGDRDKSGQEQV